MSENQHPESTHLVTALCRELVRLARREEELAATEAARTPYWTPVPASVIGHRLAAQALRDTMARIEASATQTLSIAS